MCALASLPSCATGFQWPSGGRAFCAPMALATVTAVLIIDRVISALIIHLSSPRVRHHLNDSSSHRYLNKPSSCFSTSCTAYTLTSTFALLQWPYLYPTHTHDPPALIHLLPSITYHCSLLSQLRFSLSALRSQLRSFIIALSFLSFAHSLLFSSFSASSVLPST